MEKQTLYDQILEVLKKKGDQQQQPIAFVYLSCFKILGNNRADLIFGDLFEEWKKCAKGRRVYEKAINQYRAEVKDITNNADIQAGPTWPEEPQLTGHEWFVDFHKHMHRSDFYGGGDESYFREWTESKMTVEDEAELATLNTWYKPLFKSFQKKHNEYSPIIREICSTPENKQKYDRRVQLLTLKNNKERASIVGYLDMVLYNTIDSDEKNILFETLNNVFKTYQTSKSKKIANK